VTYAYSPNGSGSADPIAAQIAQSPDGVIDLGFVSVAAGVFDDFGSLTQGVTEILDLGNLTS
jgi:hypothetical protein